MDLKKKKIASEKNSNNINLNFNIEQKNFLEKRNKSFNSFKAELEPILDSISDFLFFLDFQGNILMVNNVVLSHLGYKKEELLDMNLLNLHPSEKREEVLAVFKDILENKTDLCNIPLITKEKILIPVETKVTKGTWNNMQVIFGISRDITERKKMEQSLKESEEIFRTIADQALMGVFIMQDNSIKYANQYMQDLLDYSLEEVRKWKPGEFLNLVHPEDRKLAKEQSSKKLLGLENVIAHYQVRLLKRNGETVWIDNYSKTINYNGKLAVLATMIDITEKVLAEKRLKESEEQYRTTINSLADPLHVVDKNLKIILANPAFINWLNLLGFKSDILGKSIFKAFPFLPDTVREELEYVINSGKPIHTEESTYINDVEVITETLKIPILKEGKVDQIITIVRDITQRKKIEKALKEAYNRVNFYKDIFMHDMKNILQNLRTSLELSSLYLNNPEKLEKMKDLYDTMNEQVDRASKLVSNVQKLSQIEDSQIVLKNINLNEILDESINFLKQSIQNKKMTIEINSFSNIIYVKANALLSDVFENILFNAVRHNQNSDITINIKISQEQTDSKKYIKIEILDNGIGIEDTRKNIIFNRGTLSENTNKGMGLGLSLVKTIIDSYKGKIWVEDKIKGDYTKGSNFIILIPKE